MTRQKTYQQKRKDAGLCSQCGAPARPRRDGVGLATKCQACYDKARDGRARKRAADAADAADAERAAVLLELAEPAAWRCPVHPDARPMLSQYIPDQYICTVRFTERVHNSERKVQRFCSRKSTDMPEKSDLDSYRMRNGGRLMWESEPPPDAYVLQESDYMRWHYREHGRLPWRPESDQPTGGKWQRVLARALKRLKVESNA